MKKMSQMALILALVVAGSAVGSFAQEKPKPKDKKEHHDSKDHKDKKDGKKDKKKA